MTRDEIFQGVRECVGIVVDKDPLTLHEKDRIIEDLGADSLDLLDLVFHLEQRFHIKISPRDIERRAQARLGKTPMEIDGVYTPQALEQLRKAMPEVPREELVEGMLSVQLPRRFRVATFVNLVIRLLEEQRG